MTDAQNKMKKYTNAIERKLNMPKDVKTRVMTDFISSIQGRRESGQTDEEIFAELGSPKKVAADLNEQMKDYTYVKSPWRWVCLAIIIGCMMSFAFGGTIGMLVHLLNASVSNSIGIIGGADGPTAIFVTSGTSWLNISGFRGIIAVAVLVIFFIYRNKK